MIILYKKDSKDKIRIWRGFVDDDEVVTETGLLHGKLKEERRRAKPKNVGRANETSGSEQAALELISKSNKERDKGYFDTVSLARMSTVVLPMLAHKVKEKKKYMKYPGAIQPKLDGIRCTVDLDTIAMRTRTGKSFPIFSGLIQDLRNIKRSISRLKSDPVIVIPDRLFLDGELFSDHMTFQELVGHARRMNQKPEDAEALATIGLRVFDCFSLTDLGMPFRNRMRIVRDLLESVAGDMYGLVKIVPTDVVNSEEELMKAHAEYTLEGHEGTIFRNAAGPYKLNGRSNDLLKYKDFIDKEFPIVGACEGEGRDEGTVVWVCETEGHKVFNARPRGTWEQRHEWWQNWRSYEHLMLTVRFQNYTDDGIPRFPVGIAIRNYE